MTLLRISSCILLVMAILSCVCQQQKVIQLQNKQDQEIQVQSAIEVQPSSETKDYEAVVQAPPQIKTQSEINVLPSSQIEAQPSEVVVDPVPEAPEVVVEPVPEEQIILSQIKYIYQQKQQIVVKRSAHRTIILSAIDSLKQLQPSLHQPKIEASDAYTNYYNAKIACDSYIPNLDFIETKNQITFQQCFTVPLAAQSHNLYVQSAQYDGFQLDRELSQALLYAQTAFADDASSQVKIYDDLKSYFVSRNQTLYNTYFLQAFNSQNAYLQESQLASLRKLSLQAAQNIEDSTKANIQAVSQPLIQKVAKCRQNVASLKTVLEQKLAVVNTIYLQAQEQRKIINDGLSQLDVYYNQLRSFQYQLQSLAATYQHLYSENNINVS